MPDYSLFKIKQTSYQAISYFWMIFILIYESIFPHSFPPALLQLPLCI
jgi:hypothetical protein